MNPSPLENYPRTGGAILFAISLFLGKLCFLDPWNEAQAGASSVEFSFKGAVLSASFLAVSLFLLIFGMSGRRLMYKGDTRELSPMGWILTIAFVAFGFATTLVFKSKLASLGYHF